MSTRMELDADFDLPRVHAPTDLGALVCAALARRPHRVRDEDILVVAHKLVSKAEGRVVRLDEVEPTVEAARLAAQSGKDPRLVEVILRESSSIVRATGPHLIMEHHLGFVCANAAVDRSNAGGGDRVVLLPLDPDGSAARLRSAVAEAFGADVGVVIADSHGRPFRNGAVGVAVGLAGLPALASWRGRADLDGRTLETTEEAVADELAAAATLLMGQGDEGRPLVLVRGYLPHGPEQGAGQLVRERRSDLFRT